MDRTPWRARLEQAERGLVASEEQLTVVNADGGPVWDVDWWLFLAGKSPDSVNPSLWRLLDDFDFWFNIVTPSSLLGGTSRCGQDLSATTRTLLPVQ